MCDMLLSVMIWYIAGADCLIKTLPPSFRQVWGYPDISGQNIKFLPILLLLTFVFISRFKKTVGV